MSQKHIYNYDQLTVFWTSTDYQKIYYLKLIEFSINHGYNYYVSNTKYDLVINQSPIHNPVFNTTINNPNTTFIISNINTLKLLYNIHFNINLSPIIPVNNMAKLRLMVHYTTNISIYTTSIQESVNVNIKNMTKNKSYNAGISINSSSPFQIINDDYYVNLNELIIK